MAQACIESLEYAQAAGWDDYGTCSGAGDGLITSDCDDALDAWWGLWYPWWG